MTPNRQRKFGNFTHNRKQYGYRTAIRLNFLDEAEEYLDTMESGLLGLADTVIEAQNIDLVLRFAHSIKGGAGDDGFLTS